MMESLAAHALAALIVLAAAVIAAAVWYYKVGWQPFSFAQAAGAAPPSWSPSGTATVDRLRFRKVVFTVTPATGSPRSVDVSAVLNGMAVAYRDAVTVPDALSLVRSLNPYSFVITGFNDSSVTTGASDPLAGATAELSGVYRTI